MPVVQPPAKVLVSGANGFVAIWVVKSLLDKGYSVRATVRSLDKGKHLSKVFSQYGDKLELVVVEDVAKEGAFDEAVKDVDAIEHTASPFTFEADDPQELIGPAIKGTVGILKSAQKYGERVKRVVVTSSAVAMLGARPPGHTYTEADWNDSAVNEVKTEGRNASGSAKYCASKTLAERAAWEFYEANKSVLKWDMVVLNPPWIYGPNLHEVSSPKALNTSSASWYKTIVARTESLDQAGSTYIDVRDVGEFHALSLLKEKAGGERFIISAGFYTWQGWLDAANGKDVSAQQIVLDTSKSDDVFGLKYTTMSQSGKDMMEDFKARGW